MDSCSLCKRTDKTLVCIDCVDVILDKRLKPLVEEHEKLHKILDEIQKELRRER